MKKTLLLSLLIMSLCVPVAWAQPKNQQGMLLSNYTYTLDRKLVGKVVPAAGFAAFSQIKLKGESAKYFSVDKANQLSIKKNAIQDDVPGYDLTIEAKTKDGQQINHAFYILKDQFKRNKVIAHRGAWKNTGATENSIGALQHASEMGCEGSEFDVHMSADSVVFVHHDHEIDGVHIEKTSSDVLSKMKLSNGEFLPTLESYLKTGIRQHNTKLILEIKTSSISKERALLTAEKCVDLVRQYKAEAWVDYIAFDYGVCKKVMEMDPFAKVAYLNGEKSPAELAADKFYGLDYHINVMKKNENWIKESHERKLTVNVWTVNDAADMDWLLNRQVDFITTNEPELLLTKINK